MFVCVNYLLVCQRIHSSFTLPVKYIMQNSDLVTSYSNIQHARVLASFLECGIDIGQRLLPNLYVSGSFYN